MTAQDHRIRLTDDDLDLIIAALRARLSALRGSRRQRIQRLILRLEELAPGNPNWRL